ncbi:MAG: FtsW/RodA/SpoVE family cell cycle protein [Patescibacteria group bacterium]
MGFKRAYSMLQGIDPWIVIPTLLLFTTSIVVLFSIDHATGGGDRAAKQVIFAAIGLALFAGLSFIRTATFEAFGPWVFVLAVLLLLAVLLFGQTINGTTGWFVLGPISFQPVELVKICFIWTLSWYLSRLDGQTFSWKPILLSFALLVGLVGLVLLQPDFGSSMMLVAIWLGMIVLVHRTKWHLGIVALGIVVTVVVGWFLLADYQQNRLLTFMNPDLDPLGSGYNVQQSIIATGSGGWFGRGLGLGPQSQLHFLPEQSTDFIFSVIGEELGFLGGGTVLVVYLVLLWRLNLVSRLASGSFGSLMAHGVLIYFLGQVCINVGMNLGLAPVTGLPLPLVSAGGSSIIASCIGLGLVQSAAKTARPRQT